MEGNLYPRTNVEKKKHGIFQRCLVPLFRARCTLCLAKETRSCSNRKYAANTSTYVFGMLTVSLTQRMNKSLGIQPVWVGKRPRHRDSLHSQAKLRSVSREMAKHQT